MQAYADWEQKQNNTSWHLPGTNYTGPGTNVVSNILKGIKPSNKLDLESAKHDLHCIATTGCSDKSNLTYLDNLSAIPGVQASVAKVISSVGYNTGLTKKLTTTNPPFTPTELKIITNEGKKMLNEPIFKLTELPQHNFHNLKKMRDFENVIQSAQTHKNPKKSFLPTESAYTTVP
jgi:hypothetical protein